MFQNWQSQTGSQIKLTVLTLLLLDFRLTLIKLWPSTQLTKFSWAYERDQDIRTYPKTRMNSWSSSYGQKEVTPQLLNTNISQYSNNVAQHV